jgi:Tfp pilus assembly protein PilV
MSKLKTQNQNSNVKTSGTQGGQTLVEVLAGLGLILIVVTALIGMGVVALKTSTAARNQTVAAKLADEGMEIARSVRDQGTLADVVDFDDAVTVGSVTFTRERRVSGPADEKTVVVTVSWSESSGTKSVSVSSYLTDWR